MKIAMLTSWFPPLIVGSGNRFYEVGKRLSKKHEVHVYTTGIEGCVNEEKMNGMYVHRYGVFDTSRSIEKRSYILNFQFSLHILKKLKNNNFDIIDCNIVSKTLPYASYIVSRSTHAPLIETWHEVWYKENFKQYNPLMAVPGFFMELFIPKLSDINIAVSETTKKRLVNLLNIDPDKIVVISNGVDLEKFSRISAKKRYGRILYVGRLESHKRVDTLMLAYHRLKKKYANIELIIVGNGPQKEFLQKLSEKLKLKDVRFCDPVPYEELIAIMKSSWVLVLPSIMEGQGIVLLEAMAAGTPPIAVQAEGSAVGDVILNLCNGLLVQQDQLEGAIQKLLTEEDLYFSLRNNGLKFVEEYDWNKIAEGTMELYKKTEEHYGKNR
jgi:glycosyltransferase involved in cell wall biosynthesis